MSLELAFPNRTFASRWKAALAIGLVAALLATAATAQTRPALVRDVDRPAGQPFAANGFSAFAAEVNTASRDLLTVPAGKRAVVEHVSCINYLESGNNFIRMELRYTLGGQLQKHQFVHTRVGASFVSNIDVLSFSQPVRLYADAGTTVEMSALRRSSAGSGGIECQISGHYVDAL